MKNRLTISLILVLAVTALVAWYNSQVPITSTALTLIGIFTLAAVTVILLLGKYFDGERAFTGSYTHYDYKNGDIFSTPRVIAVILCGVVVFVVTLATNTGSPTGIACLVTSVVFIVHGIAAGIVRYSVRGTGVSKWKDISKAPKRLFQITQLLLIFAAASVVVSILVS